MIAESRAVCQLCGTEGANQQNVLGRVIGPPEGWGLVTVNHPKPVRNLALCPTDLEKVLAALRPALEIEVVHVPDIAVKA